MSIALLAAAAAMPLYADALSLYSYVPGEGFARAREYEAIGIEKVAEDASRSVAAIEGYKESPVYSMDVEEDTETGEFSLVVRETGTVTKKATSGTGFFVTEDGYMLTNRHVVDDPDADFVVDIDGSGKRARVVYLDPVYDLAVVKVEGAGYPAIRLADPGEIEVGEEVASVGNALGRFVDSVSSGRVISLDETVVARDRGSVEILRGLIATDARLYPGDSGGPLLNANGEVVGVNVAIEEDANVSFSIPLDAVRLVMERAGISV